MAYIRAKIVNGEKYLYLVKSVWDSKKNTSKQETIKYLGKASDVTIEDIPIDYRDNPKITTFLSAHAGQDRETTKKLIEKVKEDFFNSLTKGDLDKSLEIYESYSKSGGINLFYENILKPVMYKIGELWGANKISIATEHVASNIAHELVSIIAEKISKLGNKCKILVCTPSGEEHSLGCRMIESFLKSKGYRVFNLSPSAPAESILHFISEKKPDIVMISITIEDNIKSGQRLVNKINSSFEIPIMVGGQAIENKNYKFNAEIIEKQSIDKIPKIIKHLAG